ncbi:MAG: hypothetical protein ACLPID_07540 [Beijerinckiaceae bacterium]
MSESGMKKAARPIDIIARPRCAGERASLRVLRRRGVAIGTVEHGELVPGRVFNLPF